MISVLLICISNLINISAFIALLLLLEPFLKKYLSAVCMYRLWLVLLLGLFLPLHVTEGNAIFHISLSRMDLEDKEDYYDNRYSNDGLSISRADILLQKLLSQGLSSRNEASQAGDYSSNKEAQAAQASEIIRSISLLLSLLWGIGFIILVIRVAGYYMYLKHLRRLLNPFDRSKFLEIYQRCIQEIWINAGNNLSRAEKIKIYQCPVIKSPMTIGIFKQVILLPAVDYSNRDFYFVIKHELIHIRRKDSFVKLMRMLVLSFNWYNPLCYILSRRLEEWCEASCDERVLRNLNRSDCLYYGRLILRFVMPHENKAFTVNLIGGKKDMKKRLISIVEHRKKYSGNIMVLMAVFIVFTMAIIVVNHGEKVSASNDKEAVGYQAPEPSVYPELATEAEADQADQITSDAAPVDARTSEELREAVVEYAIQAESTPYMWGGNKLDTGVDCSGYVQAIYGEAGYTLPRTSREQASEYEQVSLDKLKPGDLIFYGNAEDKLINHVGIYIGDKKILHATNMRDGVKISDYDYRPIISAARVITD